MSEFFSVAAFFKKNKGLFVILCIFLITSLLAQFIANSLPLYARYKGHSCFPAFNESGFVTVDGKKVFYQNINWKQEENAFKIFPPVAWSPFTLDYANADYASPLARQVYHVNGMEKPLPFCQRHHLGTDKLGRDVLAGIIHGMQSSVLTGLLAMLIAGLIATATGSVSGYFKNDGIKISLASLISLLLSIPALYFYAFELQRFNREEHALLQTLKIIFIVVLIVFIAWIFKKLLFRISLFQKKILFPADRLITGITELITAMPRLILILTLGALFKPSLLSLAWIIGLTSWTEMSRLLRASIMSEKEKGYVEGARMMGFSPLYIIRKHILPNALTPMLVALTFGISATIMTESSLTFLGIGLPPETVSWGSLLAQSKENFQAWWLALFPGLAIFITVFVLNKTADALQRFNNPKM